MRPLSAHVSIDITSETLDELLCQASYDGDVEQFRFMVQQGADPLRERWILTDDDDGHETMERRQSFLLDAIERGRPAMVELLIDLGADIHQCCPRFRAWPLLRWVLMGRDVPHRIPEATYAAVGHALLAAGANPSFVPDEIRRGRTDRGSARWRAKQDNVRPALAVLEAFDAYRRAQALSRATAPVAASAVRARL